MKSGGDRIGVALSGGVDSTYTAWSLLKAGHQLAGYSLKLGRGPDAACHWGARVAGQLGIPHRVVDASGRFEDVVVKPAVEQYAIGRTPNPCALCNAGLKLPLLWQAARADGCAALATGHYARLKQTPWGPLLAEGQDRKKSQAYFLARVSPKLLDLVRFPLGGLTKAQVKALAAEAGLEAAARPESQDLCFMEPGGWDQLMAEYRAVRSGVVEDSQGRVLGEHQGLHRYTVGQRRGLGLALGTPVYVLALDGRRAAVTVGPAEQLSTLGLWATDPVWYAPPEDFKELTVRFRYSHPGVGAEVRIEDDAVRVDFTRPQGAVAPGQLAVFFHQDLVVGSAWIKKPIY